VRAKAAIVLFRAGQTEPARSSVRSLLDSSEPAGRSAGLEACGRLGVCFDSDQIAVYLTDESIQVRLAAIQALEIIGDEPARQALLQALDDPQERVRLAAGRALQPVEAAWPALLEVLNTGSEHAQAAALMALEGRGTPIRPGVTDWALAQIPHTLQLRGWAETMERSPLKRDSQALAFLAALLRRKESQAIQLILQALALIEAPETMRLARRGLGSSDPERRAQALEAIDAVGDKRVTRGLLPLLEGPPPEPVWGVQKVLAELAGHPDRWLKALAARAASDLQASGMWLPATGRLELGGHAAAQTVRGGEMPETYQTLVTMDRILFLRQVPIFAELGPEDLQSIAEIASERIVLAGDTLCREGEIGDEMFILVEGEARITRGEGDKVRLLRIARPGEHIGEFAILRQQPRAASVIAQGGDIRVLALQCEAVKTILHERPEVAMAMLANLAERLSARE
jgi:HEAT repeat protein